MAEVSHNGRRKPRPWTAQEQAIIEVAAACEVNFCEIGRVINRHRNVVKRNLLPNLANALKLYGQRWREANRDKDRENSRRYYYANREKARQWGIAYRAANHERTLERRRKYYLAHKEEQKQQMRNWYNANKERVKELVRRRKTRLRIARTFTQLTLKDKLRRFALWSHHCAYCGAAGKMTVDHVLAILHGGLDQSDNVVPACRSCNCSKQASPVEDWYRAQPFFSETRWRKIQQHCPAAVTGQLSISIGA